MAYPVYEDNGGIAAGTGFSVTPSYPGTVDADDILLAMLGDADSDSFIALDPGNKNLCPNSSGEELNHPNFFPGGTSSTISRS